MDNLRINKLFIELDDYANKTGFRLTYSDKNVYVSLLELSEKVGIKDENDKVYVQFSREKLSNLMNISKSAVQTSIKHLSAYNLLYEIVEDKSFKPLDNNRFIVNKPNRIYVLPID